jgi:hypothetical protein
MEKWRNELKRMRESTGTSSFQLEDGSHFYFEPSQYGLEVFMASMQVLEADGEGEVRSPPHPLLVALARAKDRRAAMRQVYPNWREKPPMLGYDLGVLVREGRLEPYSLVKGREPIMPEDGV